MRLAIISHTEHYISDTGRLVGWGPTITEINHLTEVFDEIYHLAMLKDTAAPASALPYTSEAITFVPIASSGGSGVLSKLDSLAKAPKVISLVTEVLKKVDVFQLRTPTGMGVYLIPYLTFFVKTPGWYKYAGNWKQKNAPFGYALQRQFLKWQHRKVTINGFWDDQPKHCVSFENPCLTDMDIADGIQVRGRKQFKAPFYFCFVGRLEKEKGVERLIAAMQAIPHVLQQRIAGVHLVGDGADRPYFESLALLCPIPFTFHGFIPREAVHEIYKQSHVFVLPTTASEGFPKVIAEAMNFGCIPIVSDLSAISHYVHHGQQGFLLNPVTVETLEEAIAGILNLDEVAYQHMRSQQEAIVKNFTFTHHHKHIQTELLS